MSWIFTSGGQSIGASAWVQVPQMNIQGLFPSVLTDFISAQSKGLSRAFSNGTFKASILQCSAFFMVQFSHPYMTTGKTIALTRWTFVGKVMSLLFNMLSRLAIAFPKSKCLLISWLQSPSAITFGAPQNKSHCFNFSPSIHNEEKGPDVMILVFWMLNFKTTFSLSSFTFIKRPFSPLQFLP